MDTQAVVDHVEIISKNTAIIVNAKKFLKSLKFVTTSVCKQNNRPILKFIHVEIGSGELTLESTDSHKLTQIKVPASINDKLAGREFLLSGKFARDLSKSPTKHGIHLAIEPDFDKNGKSTGFVKFIDGNNEIFIESHEHGDAHYPELDNLIPHNKNFVFETRKKELMPVLKQLKKSSTNEKIKYMVHLEIRDNKHVLLGVNDDVREIKPRNLKIREEHLVQEENELNLEVYFNVAYLISELNKCDNTEFLKFAFHSMLRPFTFTRENGGIGEICPIRNC